MFRLLTRPIQAIMGLIASGQAHTVAKAPLMRTSGTIAPTTARRLGIKRDTSIPLRKINRRVHLAPGGADRIYRLYRHVEA